MELRKFQLAMRLIEFVEKLCQIPADATVEEPEPQAENPPPSREGELFVDQAFEDMLGAAVGRVLKPDVPLPDGENPFANYTAEAEEIP